MTTVTRETLTKILIETMALIKERSSRTGNSSGISTEVNAELFAEVTRIALASLEAVPVYQVVYDSDTWRDINQTQFADHVNHGSPVRIVYAAPPAPVVPPEKNDSDYVTDCHGVPSLEDCAHQRGWNECRAAILQGAEPVSNRDELLTVCAEAYQVVGAMAEALGIFDSTEVQKVMDNLSQQKLVHADVLPFAVPGGNSPVIPDSLVMATIIDV